VPLTEEQAFAAMFKFLTGYWERNGRPDEIGGLLGSLNPELTGDGKPADPAAWSDWIAAVRAIQKSEP
jgi:hypothetical protein